MSGVGHDLDMEVGIRMACEIRSADLTHAAPEDGRTNQIDNSYIPGTSAPAAPLPDDGPPVDWPSNGF